MKVVNTKFEGLKIIQQKKHKDNRGNLRETYLKKIIKWNDLIFDYATTSKKNVLRGFHFQSKFKQAKFVTVLKGKILDCVIDLRKNSKTFGKSFSIELSEKNCKSLYIPEGFAHAYYSFSKVNIIYYKLSNYYHPEFEDGILWNDIALNNKWPTKNPNVSKKDKKLKTLIDFKKIYKGL
jgi:dTDP-4-dehydrorhamnose 3,5-epimerase|tara:strand:+ start:1770 stop:2306 length:537 start_codon:yes stop_codon:yes gene_type:complete